MYNPTFIVLNGNVGQDFELQTSKGGNSYCRFSVATSQGKDKDSCWTDVTCFGDLAEQVTSCVGKGSKVIVTGRLQEDVWESDDGKRRKHFLIADEVAVKVQDEALAGRRGGSAPDFDESDLPPALR